MTLLDEKNMPKAAQKKIKKRGNMRTCCSTFVDEPHNGMAHCPPLGVFNDKERKVLASWLRDWRHEILPERAPIKAELGVDLVKVLLKLVVEIEKI